MGRHKIIKTTFSNKTVDFPFEEKSTFETTMIEKLHRHFRPPNKYNSDVITVIKLPRQTNPEHI